MAVDEKYVETVGEEKEEVNYEDILAEFGAEADFVEDESGITVPADYWNRTLKQLPTNGVFAGKPHLGVPEKIEWDVKDENGNPTGEKQVNYQVKCVVIDDLSKEAYTIPINLKSMDTVHENLFPSSKLYALQMGLMELKAPGIARTYNRLTVDLDKLRKILENMEEMYFKVVLIDGGDFTYKSFRIVGEDEV